MYWKNINNLYVHVYILCFFLSGLRFSHGNLVDSKILNVGEELLKQTLPLQMGSQLYQLQGLKPNTWYEVKISYPASIPATFSLQLKRSSSDMGLKWKRMLLNTEKLIFKSDNLDLLGDQEGRMYVLVTVEPEGIVAIPGVQERKDIIFNIVCDELLLGIPHQAWWVVILVVFCLAFALVIPFFLPPLLLPSGRRKAPFQTNSKNS